MTGSSTPNGYCVAVAVLRHGRDVLLTKDKSITGERGTKVLGSGSR